MKKALLIVGAALLLVAAGLAIFVLTFEPAQRPTTDLEVVSSPAGVERGRYLVETVLACGDCHSPIDATRYGFPTKGTPLSGNPACLGDEIAFPGRLCAGNLTPDPETGLGSWSDDEILRAFREGIHRDGSALFPLMPYAAYRSLGDLDAHAVVAYLRSLAPVKQAVPDSEVPFPISFFIQMAPEPITEPVETPGRGDPKVWGAYLANIAGCRSCHTPMDDRHQPIEAMAFAGGMEWSLPGQAVRSANITSHASGSLPRDPASFVNLFRGFADVAAVAQPIEDGKNTVMPWYAYARMEEADLLAIHTFLMSLEPIEQAIEKYPPAP